MSLLIRQQNLIDDNLRLMNENEIEEKNLRNLLCEIRDDAYYYS